jgi:hypothetical protein
VENEPYAGLTNLLNSALERVLEERGFQFPLYATMVGTNGVMYMFVYEDVGAPRARGRVLAEYEPEDIMALPIHGLIVSSDGQGAHVVFPTANAVEFRD